MKKENWFDHESRRYLLIGIIGITVISVVVFSFYSSNRMINKYYPLVDATMEVKLEATTAHLWLEEIISGDRFTNFEDIITHIDQALWYAGAMLEGGKNPEGIFLPLSDQVLRREVAGTIEHLQKFKEITYERYEAVTSSGIGSEIDQKYDKLFQIFIRKIDNVETLLQQKIRKDDSRHQILQILLIAAVVLLSMLGFYIQLQYDRKQKKNIVEINKARDRAEKNEQWLKTTMNSMGDGVIITDHNGRVIYLNPVASSLTGWLLNDAKNRKMTEIFNIVNEQTKEPVDDPVNMVIRNNVVVGLANHTELISRDGKVWPIADSAAPIFDHDNDLIGVVIVFHEVSEQKKAETERAKLEAQLQQAFKMEAIGTMAGGIAHDFNNILAIIIGNADMALDDIPAENPAKHNVEEVLEAANRAKELVKQILSFSRREKRKKEPFYFCRLVEKSMKSLRSTIPTSVELKINIPEKCRAGVTDCLMVNVDPIQIHQLLLNLSINAVQAMEEKGILEITVNEVIFGDNIPADRPGFKPGSYEHLAVIDTGPGMSSELIEQIFDPFFTTKEVGKGTGMGLSVVHGIIESHDGKIFVESTPGKGTTFHVYFPGIMKKESEKEIEETGTLPTGNETILLVDDEEMLAKLGKRMIEKLGYSVTAKTSSVEALELFKNNPTRFDLVITDQTMPKMTGAEFAEQLLQIRPGLPIILYTGFSSKVDKEKAKQIGIREFATKPLNKRDIAVLIRMVLDSDTSGAKQ